MSNLNLIEFFVVGMGSKRSIIFKSTVFYPFEKVATLNLEEAECRIKIDEDYKKDPIFVQMLVDLYNIKGNSMLADVWKSKLSKLK